MDRHPVQPLESSIPTAPPRATTVSYRKRPRSYGMVGLSRSYSSDGEFLVPAMKPEPHILAAWDHARQKEPIIKAGLSFIALSVAGRLGPYVHPDPAIQYFIAEVLKLKIHKWIKDMTISLLWAGWCAAESVFQPRMGPTGPQVWLEDVVTYHPLDVDIVTDVHGRLVHGAKIPNKIRESGIWVPRPTLSTASVTGDKLRLSKGKVIHSCYGGEGNNPYGASFLTAVIDFHLFKKVIIDLMMIALDRYGTPLTYLVVPAVQTDQVDPDNPDRKLSLQEVSQAALENIHTESVLVFSQPIGTDANSKIEMKTLTTSNNFADSFTSASELMDQNMMTGMLIPNLIFRDNNSGLGTGGASERQMELFSLFIASLYSQVVNDFLLQAVLQLIQYNFDPREHPLAYQAGEIKPLPMRPTELKVLSATIDMMTRNGYLDPSDEEDRDHVRQLLYFPPGKKKEAPVTSPPSPTPLKGRRIRIPLSNSPITLKTYA